MTQSEWGAQHPLSDQASHAIVDREWRDVLGVDVVASEDDFFDMGGDSLALVELIARLEKRRGACVSLTMFLSRPTPRHLAEMLAGEVGPSDGKYDPVVSLTHRNEGLPLFCVHAAAGTVSRFVPLVKHLRLPLQVYGLQARGVNVGTTPYGTFEEMVLDYQDAIVRAAPNGPYLLVGYSLGGLIAYELAHRLDEAGGDVAFVGMLDTQSSFRRPPSLTEMLSWFVRYGLQLDLDIDSLVRMSESARIAVIRQEGAGQGVIDPAVTHQQLKRMADMYATNVELLQDYRPPSSERSVSLFRASEGDGKPPDLGWRDVAPNVALHTVPGDHFTLMRRPNVIRTASAVSDEIASVIGRFGG